MDKPAIILGKKVVGRRETLEYARDKFGWKNCIIGISCFFGFWAWVIGRITKRKVIYYCIDFYSPLIAKNIWDRVFIWLAIKMDEFLVTVVDEVWDISEKINEGRLEYGRYEVVSSIIPLCYPPNYFRFEEGKKDRIVFVGLEPYGLELLPEGIDFVWLGKGELLPLEDLLKQLSFCGIGISLWKEKGNNYYGDPGKTKLYSACGLPVIMTNNTPYANIIRDNWAGIVIKEYTKETVKKAIKEMIFNYDFYKRNVKKTWEYINADNIFRNIKLLG